MAKKDTSGKDSPKNGESKKPRDDAAKADKKKPQSADDDLYDQGDIATPRRDPPYEDGI